MKWAGRRQSSNVESGGGGMGRMATGGGIGTLVIGLLIYFLGGDPSAVLNSQSGPRPANYGGTGTTQRANLDTKEEQFVATVLADTEDVWNEIFRRAGRQYREPKLVIFSDQVQSGCGIATSATGPFYCPLDEKLYIDFSFFRDLDSRYGAPGDFAQAYVLAHEVGHHVQNQLGVLDKVDALKRRVDKADANALSVRVELQADYYAGVWAHYAQKRGLLDPGDIEEGLNAAAAVGDDNLQQQARGYVVPETFTHGTSQQRATWFNRGLQSGDIRGGNTFQ